MLNEKIVDEYYDVLRRPKFRFDEAAVEIIMKELLKRGIFVNAEDTDEKLPDSGDQIFYNVVMEKRKTEETWLVTGNIKHFPERSFVVTPREMLDMLNQK